MTRVLGCFLLCAMMVFAAACGSSHRYPTAADPSVKITAEKPPSPASWPAYPHFSQPSCWGRPFGAAEPIVDRVAPSYLPAPRAHPIPPTTVARRLLARFGDRRYIRSITFAPAPPAVGSRVHVLYAGGHPPADALKATIVAPEANANSGNHPTPTQSLTAAIASWEAGLIGGALRDDLCSAGGAPLVMWSGAAGGFSEKLFALEQRFPNPSPSAFRRRVRLVGRRYGFRVASLKLLHPRQLAPLLIVETSRSRKAFVRDIPAIMNLLEPTTNTKHESAQTFEGFLFAAEDAHGPFAETQYVSRGEGEGGEWSWNPCVYPYPTLGGPLGRKCP